MRTNPGFHSLAIDSGKKNIILYCSATAWSPTHTIITPTSTPPYRTIALNVEASTSYHTKVNCLDSCRVCAYIITRTLCMITLMSFFNSGVIRARGSLHGKACRYRGVRIMGLHEVGYTYTWKSQILLTHNGLVVSLAHLRLQVRE
jgi:hypothetical protein